MPVQPGRGASYHAAMALTGDQAAAEPLWVLPGGTLSLGCPRVMAVVNVTPDSFSDGGRFVQDAGVDVAKVVGAARRLVEEGADILDIGGESTRPGAQDVPVREELSRVIPSIEAICRAELGVPLSIDTRKAQVASRAVQAGAQIVNDVSGLADPGMAPAVAASGAGLVIGHLRGVPGTMQHDTRFEDVFEDVAGGARGGGGPGRRGRCGSGTDPGGSRRWVWQGRRPQRGPGRMWRRAPGTDWVPGPDRSESQTIPG